MLIDKDKYRVYNISMNKNRGMNMDKNFRTVLVWWMAIMICLLFLRFAVQMDRMRKNKEVIEKWSEASERGRNLERILVKSLHFNLYLKLIVISDKKSI